MSVRLLLGSVSDRRAHKDMLKKKGLQKTCNPL